MIYHGDLFEVLPTLAEVSVDACVCDPPYGLEFMGSTWDRFDGRVIDPAFMHWFAGFTDGEGCFHVHAKPQQTFDCQFTISLRADDRGILERIQRTLGMGTLSSEDAHTAGNGHPKVRYCISRKADCVRLRDLFRAFPLRAKKARDFEIWSDALAAWMRHEHGESWEDMAEERQRLKATRAYAPEGVRVDPFQYWAVRWGREVLRVLKPGAHLVTFGGTRTHHRLMAGLEDAGFEIRDCLMWLYGSGFPKSLNLGDGRGTALKPGWEPIILARKPLAGTVAKNVQTHGTGALNIDGCRIETGDNLNGGGYTPRAQGNAWAETKGMNATGRCADGPFVQPTGRWPPNVLLDEDAARQLDAQSGELVSGSGDRSPSGCVGLRGNIFSKDDDVYPASMGGASRFFYVAKPDRAERDLGCAGLSAATGGEATDRVDGTDGLNSPRAGAGRKGGSRNVHPTVKPIEVMRWLVRLVTPPNGTVLDPFMGSGTTGMACRAEQRAFIGVEREAAYVAIAERRLAAIAPLFHDNPVAVTVSSPTTQPDMFEEIP